MFETETGELRDHLRGPDSLDAVEIIGTREFEYGRGLVFAMVLALALAASGVWERRCDSRDDC
jgi:hypothetical protein